jgi:hypothetical protein
VEVSVKKQWSSVWAGVSERLMILSSDHGVKAFYTYPKLVIHISFLDVHRRRQMSHMHTCYSRKSLSQFGLETFVVQRLRIWFIV